jgi:hypothetical protein
VKPDFFPDNLSLDLSDEDFLDWLLVPENEVKWRDYMKSVAGGEVRGTTRELLKKANRMAVTYKLQTQLQTLQEKIGACIAMMARPVGTMRAEDRLAQVNSTMNEAVDAADVLPEPHRARFLREIMGLREKIGVIKIEP